VDFVACYNPKNRHRRKATRDAETNPEGRWRRFAYQELAARDKTRLDVFWLKDKSLTDLDNLPEPDELAEEIIENLEAGLNSFRKVLLGLNKPAHERLPPTISPCLRASVVHLLRDLPNLSSSQANLTLVMKTTINLSRPERTLRHPQNPQGDPFVPSQYASSSQTHPRLLPRPPTVTEHATNTGFVPFPHRTNPGFVQNLPLSNPGFVLFPHCTKPAFVPLLQCNNPSFVHPSHARHHQTNFCDFTPSPLSGARTSGASPTRPGLTPRARQGSYDRP
jgi:hypothetical protein